MMVGTLMSTTHRPPSPGVYLFLGPARARKIERVEAVATHLHVHLLDRETWPAGAFSSAHQLSMLLRQQPLASGCRLMVIDDAHRLPEACCRALEEYAKDGLLTSTVILLMDTELSSRHSLSALAKLASREEFAPLEAAQAGRWARDYLAQQGKQIDEAALGELLHQHGGETSALRAVLDQLMNWIGERPRIELGDLEAFGWRSRLGKEPFGGSSKGAFALVEAIGRRNARSALAVLQEQLAAGKDELELLGLVIWQLQRWALVSRLRESHVPRPQLADVAGLPMWQLDRVLKELSGRSHVWVCERLRECAELDLAAKSGRVPLMRGALEQLALTLCLPASAARLS